MEVLEQLGGPDQRPQARRSRGAAAGRAAPPESFAEKHRWSPTQTNTTVGGLQRGSRALPASTLNNLWNVAHVRRKLVRVEPAGGPPPLHPGTCRNLLNGSENRRGFSPPPSPIITVVFEERGRGGGGPGTRPPPPTSPDTANG